MRRLIACAVLLVSSILATGAQVGGTKAPNGADMQMQLPSSHHVRNRGGSDGAGLCVFASLRHTGDWQDNAVFFGLFEHMFNYPGGGYPSKVDAVVKRYAAQRGLPVPKYIQIEDADLEILKLACKNGYMPGVTYSFSPTGRYGGSKISHMVTLVHADDNYFAILDNNYPGSYEWMTPEEFKRTYAYGGQGWSVILLEKSPPPAPRNKKK